MRVYLLLALLVIVWGLSWPVSKLGLEFMPAIWFAVWRLLIGMLTLFLIVSVTGNFVIPQKEDLPMIFVMGIFQMGIFISLVMFGLHYVDAGRSAMLVYTTPLWVIPLSVLMFKEKLTTHKTIGLIFGVIGIVLLFSPWEMNWSDNNVLIGNGLLMIAALCWAISILCARHMVWHHTPLALVPWQILVGVVPVFILAFWWQPHPIIQWNSTLLVILLFVGIFATAFGFWGTLVVSKMLPSITVSFCYLAIPVAGLIFSALILHEIITVTMMVAMIFTIAGVAFVAL